jgi:rod shape determining protein RodA
MEEKRLSLLENLAVLDKTQLFSVFALFFLGVLAIFSAGAGFDGRGVNFASRQLVWGACSVVAFLVTLRIGYEKFLREAYLLYGISLLLLLSVMVLGMSVKGSQRWIDLGIFRFQPTEFVKITLILVLSKHVCRYPPVDLPSFLGAFAIAALSGILVLAQPDAGSAIVYAVISFVAIVVAGAPWRYPAGLLAATAAALPFAWHLLKEYQKMRIRVFIDPWIDPLGAGYNVIQSRIAVGSGGLLGKGFMEGLQSKLRFLPEPHTDFIFSVFSEEFGFVGSVGILFLFALFFWRLIDAGLRTKDNRAKVLIAGISTWFWFQMLQSIGMSMGLLPVTGLPLPLVSYGGSSLLSFSIALGLAQSVYVSTLKRYR